MSRARHLIVVVDDGDDDAARMKCTALTSKFVERIYIYNWLRNRIWKQCREQPGEGVQLDGKWRWRWGQRRREKGGRAVRRGWSGGIREA